MMAGVEDAVPHKHVVAGHSSGDAAGGPLQSADGQWFLKPLPNNDARSAREASFYKAVQTASRGGVATHPLAQWVPTFGGLITAGQPGIEYLRLSDATCGMKQPCVLDIKLGFTTSSAVLCGQQHASKCAAKDAATTTTALGFRLSGCQWQRRNVDGTHVAMHRLSRAECKAVATADALATLLADFFTGSHSSDMQHAAGVAASRLHSACDQLACIHACVTACPGLRVFGCSALVVYDAAAAADGDGNAGACVTVRLVDFAHAFFTDAAGPDGNLCAGLTALDAFLQERVAARLNCNTPQ